MKTVGWIVASWVTALGISFFAVKYAGDYLESRIDIDDRLIFFGLPNTVMAVSFWLFYRVFSCSKAKTALIAALFSLTVFNLMIWLLLSRAEF